MIMAVSMLLLGVGCGKQSQDAESQQQKDAQTSEAQSEDIVEPDLKVALTQATLTRENYLNTVVTESSIAAFFKIPKNGVINSKVVARLLKNAGIQSQDADRTMSPTNIPTAGRKTELAKELNRYSKFYFGKKVAKNRIEQTIRNQGGFTPKQFLAYLRIGFGSGPCTSRVGTSTCQADAGDLQTALTKGLDSVFNLRYDSDVDDKWKNVMAVHREDIAYRIVFDLIAVNFSEYSQNPLRDIKLDVSSPNTSDCSTLASMFKNGNAFKSYLINHANMPLSLAKTTGRFIDGVSEVSQNTVTKKSRTYYYGLFNFLEGRNCSRLDANNTCYDGEPALANYLIDEKAVTRPLESGNYAWSCSEIATLIDTIVSNPFSSPYDALTSVNNYQFDANRYPLRDQPLDLTAEDVLLFYIAIGNAHVNRPGALFADNLPAADLDELAEDAKSVADLNNPEFAFQYLTTPVVFDAFLK